MKRDGRSIDIVDQITAAAFQCGLQLTLLG
jgi:hypothetical protein